MNFQSLIARSKSFLDYLARRYRLDEQGLILKKHFQVKMNKTHSADAPIMLVQCVEDYYYLPLFAEISLSIRQQIPLQVEQFVLHSLRPSAFVSLKSLFLSRFFYNRFTYNVWVNLYQTFCNKVAYRSDALFSLKDIGHFFLALSLWRKLRHKNDVINIHLDGIQVGDLICDSYLRCRPSPVLNIKDVYLLVVIWQCIRDMRLAKSYFKKVKPKLFLTSYSAYVQHGVAVRVALQEKIAVFSFGNYQEFARQLSLQNWFHVFDHENYCEQFSQLENKDEKRKMAQDALNNRIFGGLDASTAYMKRSAYAEVETDVPDVNGALVVFLHDFFDSPHCYRWMVFHDFYEWLVHTIEFAIDKKLKIFIKPHPNQIKESGEVVHEIRQRFPQIPFILPTINNRQLSLAGMRCGVSVYGTVVHELAFLGVPTICCGDNPHISFAFNQKLTAKTMEEYDNLLLSFRDLGVEKDLMLQESLEFYYMHNLHKTAEEVSLNHSLGQFRTRVYQNDKMLAISEYEKLISELKNQTEYKSTIDKFVKILEQ